MEHVFSDKNVFTERVKKMMTQHKIKLTQDDVKDFVAEATRFDFDIDIAYNRFAVDAKSILGVLALDFNKVLTVTCNGYSAEFERFLKRFSLAS
ncbi:MAG: HPr family phosphocarrier protein [Eubacteriales bacterium]